MLQNNFTFINDLPIICDENIYIHEKYMLHMNQQYYSQNTPYILELNNINISILLIINNIYNIRLKTYWYIDNSITNIKSCKYNNYYNVGYINIQARLISYHKNKLKFNIINYL